MSRITMDIEGKTYPARYEICDKCAGTGKGYLGNRGFVLTHEDFEEDPDLRDEILNGDYDQPCIQCDGDGKIKVPSTDEGWRALAEEDEDEDDAEGRRERQFEAGCAGDKEWYNIR